MKPYKDFNRLMLEYNARFRKDYDDVATWLLDLNSRLSQRAMARILRIDRGVISRKIQEVSDGRRQNV